MLQLCLNDRTYVGALSNAALPAAAWYFLFYLLFVVSLAERNNEQQIMLPQAKRRLNARPRKSCH
jgi:hypothetical protein